MQSREDCPSIKANHDVSAPNRYRWYHQDAEDGLCCKMAWTSLFTWVGLHYKRQEIMDPCVSEVGGSKSRGPEYRLEQGPCSMLPLVLLTPNETLVQAV